MSDIKFACPHCGQHLACDDLYCGEPIACPGCQGKLFVPPLAASIPREAGNMALARPIASQEKIQIKPPPFAAEPWTEARWRGHETDLGARPSGSMLPFWVMLILPFFVALLFLAHRGSLTAVVAWFLICAVVAGFYLANLHTDSIIGVIVRGVVYAVGVVVVYFVLALGMVFVGCLLS